MPGRSSDVELAPHARDVEAVHRARLRLPVLGRVLGVEPDLDRWPRGAGGSAVRRAPVGDPQLQLDQVEPGDALGDRVLDLQPGVHLQEVEASAVARRPGTPPCRRRRSRSPSPRPPRGVEQLARAAASLDQRRRRLLDDLLVPALDRALALAERPDRAVGVGEHLHLDVPAGLDVGLAEHRRVAERRLRLGAAPPRSPPGSSASSRTTRIPRPPPPADALTSTGRSASVTASGSSSASTGTPAAAISFLASILEPIARDRRRRRPDPGQPGVDAPPGEVGVLREEAVARVDGVGAGRAGGVDQQVGAQVGVGGALPAAGRRGRPRRRAGARRPRRSRRRPCRCRGRGRCGRPGGRSRRGWRPELG